MATPGSAGNMIYPRDTSAKTQNFGQFIDTAFQIIRQKVNYVQRKIPSFERDVLL